MAQVNNNFKNYPSSPDQSLLVLNPAKKTSAAKTSTLTPAGRIPYRAGNNDEKAFKKGDIVIESGVGFAIYKTKLHFETGMYTQDTTDAAGGGYFPLKGEYGITNWLGVGARFSFTNFIEETDSLTHIKATTRGIDAGIVANLHVVKSKRFDMPLSITFGYARFSIHENDPMSTFARSNGTGFGMALVPRIYFGDHLGMHFNLGFMSYNFPNFRYSNSEDANLNDTFDLRFRVKASGANIGIGLQYKL